MANIYEEKSEPLHELMSRASRDGDATVLIPDLQRPYVWTPNQVSLLVDSLIRGWPFGTLLMWKLGHDEIQSIPHRQFWRVADRTEDGDGNALTRKDPPASYQMVLDGQQRLQSLLIALGGDGWGFKMEDREWAEELQDRRPRGRQGKFRHWSKGCLCFDLDQFLNDYAAGDGLLSVDFQNVLRWVITDPADGQSKWKKPETYEEPLLRSFNAVHKGRFIRLSRLWAVATPNPNIKESGFHKPLRTFLEAEGAPATTIDKALAPLAELMTTLVAVKLSKVTFLELIAFNKDIWSEDSYNEAIVSIFTRLNTGGRTLTREEITLAWLKVGWDATATGGKSGGECFEALLKALGEQKLQIGMDNLVSAVSVLWAVSHNGGKLLENKDLLKGDVIRPMANALAKDWARVSRAILECTKVVVERDLSYGLGGQFASLNALAILWAWHFLAVSWEAEHGLTELQKDDFEKSCLSSLTSHVDRWLLGSQWAGRWTGSSNRAMAGYVKDLSLDAVSLKGEADYVKADSILGERLTLLVSDTIADATKYIETLTVQTRERVSVYRNVLWVWHRVELTRWKMSQIQLRTGKSKTTTPDVDHTVAYELWERMLTAEVPEGFENLEEALPISNRLGNCSLLDKSFNVSKSNKPLKSFINEVHEFKNNKVAAADWAKSLAIGEIMLDPSNATTTSIKVAIDERDELIRKEVIEFVKGTRSRVDV